MSLSLKEKVIGAFGAAVIVTSPAAFADDPAPVEPVQIAQLDTSPQQVSFSDAVDGIQFVHAKNVNSFGIAAAISAVQDAGCEATSLEVPVNNGRIIVRRDGEFVKGTSELDIAIGSGVEACLNHS